MENPSLLNVTLRLFSRGSVTVVLSTCFSPSSAYLNSKTPPSASFCFETRSFASYSFSMYFVPRGSVMLDHVARPVIFVLRDPFCGIGHLF